MEISVRQICFILIFYNAASKLLQYPTLLSGYAGSGLLFSALVSFAVEGAVIWAVAYLSSKTEKTLFALVKDTFGEVAARIVYGFFAVFFILCSVLPLFEHKLYVHAIFYDTVPALFSFLPVFFFTVYAGSKPFKNIGRCADICMPVFILSFAFVAFMSLSEVDYTNLLPLNAAPAKSIFGGSLKTALYFTEPAYLLMFLGHYKYKKGDAARLVLSYAGGAAIVLFFLATFYGVYGGISSSRQFAISKTSLYFSAMDMIGRVDLFALYAMEFVMLFAYVLNIQLAVHCLVRCTGFKSPEILSFAVNAALFAVIVAFDRFYTAIQSLFAGWMWIPVVLFAVALPAAAWGLRRRRNES